MDESTCLVVGVDASPESLAALEWGLMLAADLRIKLFAVHAVGLLEGGELLPHPDVASTVTAARLLHPAWADVDVDVVFEDGPSADVVARVAHREHAVLIVVGSRGLGQATRLLGSTSEAVLAQASVPVLIVPTGSSPAPPPESAGGDREGVD